MNLRTAAAGIVLFFCANLVIAYAQPAAPNRGDTSRAPVDPQLAARLTQLGNREVRLHDPSTIVRDGTNYWLFSTGRGVSSFYSPDLVNWTNGPAIFSEAPEWVAEAVPDNRRMHFWAPDVIKVGDEFLVYYSVSSFGRNKSAIALARSRALHPGDPNYGWKEDGIVVQSERTNNFNAIDPALNFDQAGRLWMSFGSFWSGIKMIELDPKTGKRIAPDSPMHTLAYTRAIEAPFIYHHDDHYYLFVNWDVCCRGTNSTYNIRVGRSKSMTGPYLDREGKDLAKEGGTLLMETDGPMIGPGHAGIYKEGDRSWFSFHFYDGTDRGASKLAIRPLTWEADGWPRVGDTFPKEDWEQATPESQGVNDATLNRAIENLKKSVGKDSAQEMAIVRNGRMIWKGEAINRVHGIWSFTKSFTSTALGLLVDDGKASLDTLAADHAPELKEHYSAVTLRHFASMTSGYKAVGDEPQGSYVHGPSRTPFTPNSEPLFIPPGSQFAYWDSAMNEFGYVLARIAGEPIQQLFKKRIADPIGMKSWTWGNFGERDGMLVNGGSGNQGKHIQISAREAARFGLLFLNRGNWDGKQLLSQKWVDEATRVQVPATTPLGHPPSDIDGRGVYGLNWWLNAPKADGNLVFPAAPRGMFWAAGHNNNKCFIIPEWNMVIVRLGLDGNVPDEVWNKFFADVTEAVGG